MILNILKLDDPDLRSEKFNELMWFLYNNDAFRFDKFYKGSLMARIRPGIGSYERKDVFHIPLTYRERASSQRFSIQGNPCLYLLVYRGLKPHNYEMVKAAWIECNMPTTFTYCIYELQKDIKVLHFGKSGRNYLSEYDYAEDEDIKKDRLEAVTQYLLSFPIRVACHISVENKLTQGGVSYHEEYLFPQLLMQWLQKNSTFDGVGYQGASSNLAQRNLYIGNLAFPARNIRAENEYDPYPQRVFQVIQSPSKRFIERFQRREDGESIDAIRTAIWELEKAGYIRREQGRDAKGKMTAIEYTIYEQPQPSDDTPPGL